MAIRPEGYEVMPGSSLPREEVVVEGFCPLDPGSGKPAPGYEIVIVLPEQYPRRVPSLYCKDASLPRDIDRHILQNGRACLCVRSESRRFLGKNYLLVNFIDRLVVPFLVGQFYYDCSGEWPWTDRSHGTAGIDEAWIQLLGFGGEAEVRAFLEALSRKNGYGGHLPCPCGSGKRLRSCHSKLFRELQEWVCWEDALADLAVLHAADGRQEQAEA